MKSFKKMTITLLIGLTVICFPLTTLAKDHWELPNGDAQLTNFNPMTLSKNLFLKHTIALESSGALKEVVVNGDKLYRVTNDGLKVIAYSLDTKAVQWEFTPPDSQDIRQIAFVDNNLAVQTYQHLYFLSDEGMDKKIVWESSNGGNLISFDSTQIYTANADTMNALNKTTGDVNWSYKINSVGGEAFHSPIVVGDPLLYFTTDNQRQMERKLYGLNKSNGTVMWTTGVDYYSTYPLLRGDKIFTSSQTEVFAYNSSTGVYLWKKKLASAYFPQYNNVFSANADTLFTRTDKRLLYAFELATGNVRFTKDFTQSATSMYSEGPLLITYDEAILGIDGKVVMYNSSTGELSRDLTIPNVKILPVLVTDKYLITASKTNLYVYASSADEQYQHPSGDQQTPPPQQPTPTPTGDEKIHVVVAGDTLWKIATQYSTTIKAIIDRNKLDPQAFLWVGQNLIIPKPQIIHIVQAGDVLWKIANQYGTTVQAIISANNLDPASYLWVGQKLIIPDPPVVYIVKAGDTLWKIATQYHTTVQAIIDKNKLDPTKYLWVGQKLMMP